MTKAMTATDTSKQKGAALFSEWQKNKTAVAGGSNSSRTLGPVADLEKHLPSEWWKTLFNSIYLKTDADVVENSENTVLEVDLLVSLAGITHADHLLDLCCGQGRHSIELAKRGFRYVSGIDRSRYLIRLARKRASELKLPVRFSEGDARKIKLLNSSIDCVFLMGNSFGYFENEEEDEAVLKAVRNVLRSEGTLFLDIVDGNWMRTHFEKRSWEWINQKLLVCRERMLASDGKRLISREVVIEVEKGVLTDQFYAERLYSFEEIEAILGKYGFSTIQNHGNVQAQSTRKQDLGMMANRMLITAKAPQKVKTLADEQAELSVTVILGDPRLPDQLKRGGQFNQEDLETIQKLKDHLKKIEGFQFSYLDRHTTLLQSLISHPPRYVLNLCDEGYKNNPLMELHVPAILEMLNVPYTGAGPACLAACYNKSWVSACAKEMDIPVPQEIWIDPSNQSAALPSIFPAILKPALGDSSFGITQKAVVHNAVELMEYFEYMKSILPNIPILIQEFLSGREYSVTIIGNEGTFEVLPILEVDYSRLPPELPHILSYESKWEPTSPYWTNLRYHQAFLEESKYRQIVDNSITLFERLECRDYARFDFREDSEGNIKLLEVNPNPGWCWDGKMNFMAEIAGIKYHQMLEMIVKAAQDRWKKSGHA